MYDPKNRVHTTLSAEFVHGTDNAATLTSVTGFSTGGGYILISGVGADAAWALYKYTGIAVSNLTGLTPCTEGNVESDAAHTFAVGSKVEVAWAAEYLKDLMDAAFLADGSVGMTGAFTQHPLSSDPGDPDAGYWKFWVGDGTDSFGAGDVCIKINVLGTTKTFRLIQYNAH